MVPHGLITIQLTIQAAQTQSHLCFTIIMAVSMLPPPVLQYHPYDAIQCSMA